VSAQSLPLQTERVHRKTALALKRMIDVVVAGVALPLLLPLLLLIAVAIRMDSGGPALLRQQRVGRGARPFGMWKFRTMVADAEQRHAALCALSHDPDWLLLDCDPRVTRVGRLLRRASLDEVPQLVNVLRGQMSLVGPRPLIPVEHERLPSWARARDDMPPGMTGLWQVSGRTTIGFEDMLRLDCRYVATWSLTRDVAALLRTIPAVLSGRGAN
jgi:lipopolysaccharide/colanic/teichoic acid biosynthesis glycosyltransferase